MVELELIDTENSYVNYLESTVSQFIDPLTLFCQEICGSYSLQLSVRILLCRNITRTLRSNMDSLIDLSRNLLQKLKSGCDIAEAFEIMLPSISDSYSYYIVTYSEVVQNLLLDIQAEDVFNRFLKTCELNDEKAGLNLNSLLIMPIQKVPKYKLFIENL